MSGPAIAATALLVAATALADYRWWRVAQREHYLPGSVIRFALRWWLLGPNRILLAAAVIGIVVSPVTPLPAILSAVAIAIGPFRYPLVGRSPGPVVWTTRLRTVAGVTAAIQVVVVAAAILLGAGAPVAGLAALTAPLVVDVALKVLEPIEDRKAGAFVTAARARLADVHPVIVGITGSYGKTTTKFYAAHLIKQARTVVATPASFNNRAGLSRAVNEHLAPGTDVFIAEMGTYGKGEIAELCSWCPPRVSAITAIGPVHLERFGSEDAIVEAKSEILVSAETTVLNVDDPRLAALKDGRTIACSALDPAADVYAHVADGRLTISHNQQQIADVAAPDVPPTNIAIAVGIALAVGVPEECIGGALGSLPSVANRKAETVLGTGATAIDDTFNSNPAGCRAALVSLQRHAVEGHKRVVVTPGMVELGPRQAEENTNFGQEAAAVATHVIVVGFTNRKALLAGVDAVPKDARAQVLLADRHERAVDWVKANTGPGDVVLYENQLPDHHP